ncbi:PASTA domain-containing protein [Streptomyces sp. NPDC020362]|uniref:PASTA domain-containing protein n=1 Tax=Streptomyces sp. NPDC020362 TaxID=3154486 RepID=UPI0033C1AFCA
MDASPTPTPSPSTSPAPIGTTSVQALTWEQGLYALLIIAVVILLIGLLAKRASADVRSWIALSLVAGLLLFSILAFVTNDTTLRTTLIGALAAAAGSATAFCFSSKPTDQAHDLLTASAGTETVPDLRGHTMDQATRMPGTTALKPVTDAPPPDGGMVVSHQNPLPGTTVVKGHPVLVTCKENKTTNPGAHGRRRLWPGRR